MAENGLSERVERIENKLDARVDDLGKRPRAGFSGLEQRMTERYVRLEYKLDQLSETRATSGTRRNSRPSKRRR
jgi:hypothetical protein